MSNQKQNFVVYENWTAQLKAVVHKSSCGHVAHDRISEQWLRTNHAPNDRWFGYFYTLKEALDFASLLPNRSHQLCGHCLVQEKENLSTY
jgi:hypothetical protein